jgi:hypothetical protein
LLLRGYRAKVVSQTAIVACALASLLAIASYCLESWPPAKSSFDPLPSVGGVIDVRILDSGWSGYKSYLYQIDVNEGRTLELENKSVSVEEFEIPPWRALPGGDSDTGRSQNFSDATGSSHHFPEFSSPDARYVVLSSEYDGQKSIGAAQIPIVVERSSDHTEVFRASVPYRFYVGGITWSPDSKAVALLLSSQRPGFGPLDILSAFSGHPIHYKSFGFLILNVEERRSVAVPRFAGGFASGETAIEWGPSHK